MASDYVAIREDNERRYGTDIGRIGQMLLANRYADRTHFIFEILQNAEDALARRGGWQGSREVTFALRRGALQVSHFGQTFDDRDVRGICGIAESTKDLTEIGRFGIGFKSVYAFTERPEVHSGAEHFAIESFVWPTAVPPIQRKAEETVFVLPLNAMDKAAHAEIIAGLQRLGPRTLLFLRQIEEIDWHVEDGPSGLYLRDKPEDLDENVRRVTLVGEEHGKPDTEQTWLVFSREAKTDEGAIAGYVELAFSTSQNEETDRWSVETVSDSSLVVFFPTVLAMHLGFLVQGPYRTTPSRDNVPRDDPWNQRLIGDTANLLVWALRWLRDHELLDVGALRCLPLDRTKFAEGSMFAPLFEAVRNALKTEPLLPRFGGGHVPANKARLARTQELRELFGPTQLASLLGAEAELAWVSSDITQARAPELWLYLTNELGVAVVTPDTVLARLDETFLEAQPDDWILKLYELLNGQPRLRRLDDVSLIRLEDGAHVRAKANGQPQAFLPSAVETSFPTVRRTVCTTDEARQFLQSLGLTEPDPVDDVVWNVLPRYRGDEVEVDDKDYEANIRRILTAFATDSKGQREKLVAALRDSTFVMAVDAGDGSKWVSKPGGVYLATERLKELFAGVGGVLIVDDAYDCLRGEDVRELLEACGATRYLQRVPVNTSFTWEQLREMRRAAGEESSSRDETLEDATLRGLDQLLGALPEFDAEARANKATLLWEALTELEDRRGAGAFSGTYRWYYYHRRSATFDASFVRQLNETAWVPDANGALQRPEAVIFESLGWKSDPFLLSKIRFKPPVIETLAKEAGIEVGVLELLKKHGVTSVAELQSRLGIEAQPETPVAGNPIASAGSADAGSGESSQATAHAPELSRYEAPGTEGSRDSGRATGEGVGSRETEISTEGALNDGSPDEDPDGPRENGSKRAPGSPGGRPFISYVGAHPDEEEQDPDGLDQEARMALEEKAVQFIIKSEPRLQRTPPFNPGYDLYEAGSDGQPKRWIEVKAMTGSLNDRPVTLSHRQFECARDKGEAYWLYVVEHAGADDGARIVRIHDPVGKIRSFTFDRGWLDVAAVEGAGDMASEEEDRGE